jgi:hypothetical protein
MIIVLEEQVKGEEKSEESEVCTHIHKKMKVKKGAQMHLSIKLCKQF